MRSWRLAGAFDAGHIRGWTPGFEEELNFHQLEMTGHAQQIESDYQLFRQEFGLNEYRDGAWLAKSFPAAGQYDWSYLDRLAAVSSRQVTLSICHYEWPAWAVEDDLWNGRVIDEMSAFAGALAGRYRGCFAAYIPVVESGYWVAMMTEWGRWWPASSREKARRWWELYSVVGPMLTGIARAVKSADPTAVIALSEPWAWHPHVSLFDQSRPFSTLLGREDSVAKRELGTDQLGGGESLLDTIGLNFYNNWGVDHGWPLHKLLLEARKYYPDKRIVMGETGNCHFSHCFTVRNWLEILDEQVELANSQGAAIEAVTWAPILTLGDFDWGKPAPGAWVTWDPDDPSRKRTWDPEVASVVRRYADSTRPERVPAAA